MGNVHLARYVSSDEKSERRATKRESKRVDRATTLARKTVRSIKYAGGSK